jgi:hypothetical protein
VGDRAEVVLLLAQPTQALQDAAGEAAADEGQCWCVEAEADRERGVEREHPLPKRNFGEQVVEPIRSRLAHAPADARGAEAATLAGERDA